MMVLVPNTVQSGSPASFLPLDISPGWKKDERPFYPEMEFLQTWIGFSKPANVCRLEIEEMSDFPCSIRTTTGFLLLIPTVCNALSGEQGMIDGAEPIAGSYNHPAIQICDEVGDSISRSQRNQQTAGAFDEQTIASLRHSH